MALSKRVAVARTSVSTAATVVALTALGLAAASWVVAVRQMNGMDMGVGLTPSMAYVIGGAGHSNLL